MKADLLIRGGTVFDGTGAPGRRGDLAVSGDRIALLGDASAVVARHTIDATGQVVAPGFIDIHTHSDISLLQDGRGQSKVSQGVTTEVTGNCGFSPFPINPRQTNRIWAGLTWRVGNSLQCAVSLRLKMTKDKF